MAASAFTVRIRPGEATVQARPDQTLLGAALAGGVPAARSCRMGYCGVCRAWLLSGAIEYPSGHRVESGAVPPVEIMLCIARPRSDLEVQLCFPQD